MGLDSRFCSPFWLDAVIAAEEQLDIGPWLRSLTNPARHELLNAVMSARLPGTDTTFFAADVINDFMRAFMTHNDLAVHPEWVWALPKEQRARWWKAIAFVFNSLSGNERGLYPVGEAAKALLGRLDEAQEELGDASLAEIRRYVI